MALVSTLIGLIQSLIQLYIFVVILAVIVSWLAAFNVINPRNDFVRAILKFLFSLTEPVFRRVRAIIPPLGNIDLSPLIVWIFLMVILAFLHRQFGHQEIF